MGNAQGQPAAGATGASSRSVRRTSRASAAANAAAADEPEDASSPPPVNQRESAAVANISALLADGADDDAVQSQSQGHQQAPLIAPQAVPAILPAISSFSAVDDHSSASPASADARQSPFGSPEPPAMAPPVRTGSARTGIGESHLELWSALVEWVSEAAHAPPPGPAAPSLHDSHAHAAHVHAPTHSAVLAWDSEEIGERVLALPTDARLLRTLADAQARRRRARAEAARASQAAARAKEARKSGAAVSSLELERLSSSTSEPASSPASVPCTPMTPSTSAAAASSAALLPPLPPSVSVPFDLAAQLLQVDSALSAMRLRWVPSRVSEDTFWQTYFSAALASVREHVRLFSKSARTSPRAEPLPAPTNPALENIILHQLQIEAQEPTHAQLRAAEEAEQKKAEQQQQQKQQQQQQR